MGQRPLTLTGGLEKCQQEPAISPRRSQFLPWRRQRGPGLWRRTVPTSPRASGTARALLESSRFLPTSCCRTPKHTSPLPGLPQGPLHSPRGLFPHQSWCGRRFSTPPNPSPLGRRRAALPRESGGDERPPHPPVYKDHPEDSKTQRNQGGSGQPKARPGHSAKTGGARRSPRNWCPKTRHPYLQERLQPQNWGDPGQPHSVPGAGGGRLRPLLSPPRAGRRKERSPGSCGGDNNSPKSQS